MYRQRIAAALAGANLRVCLAFWLLGESKYLVPPILKLMANVFAGLINNGIIL